MADARDSLVAAARRYAAAHVAYVRARREGGDGDAERAAVNRALAVLLTAVWGLDAREVRDG